MEFQTRSETSGLRFFESAKEAFDYARHDETVWKISFDMVRLVRSGKNEWKYEPLSDTLSEIVE